MPCFTSESGKLTVCCDPCFRVRTNSGRYFFIVLPYWAPPSVWHDRARKREVEKWFFDEEILAAIKWLEQRGGMG
ncbi:MAG: hypothetical protein D3910_21085 [Candidatus Electrothrix sp. ATG2]|nr:hypothetical protein [Candidatus Electrothrix sp. ATG2]